MLASLRKDAFAHVLAACGMPAAIFTGDAAQASREALRAWHMGTVLPLARMVEHELSAKLETPVKLRFDAYAKDMVSRAQVVSKLTQAGVALPTAMAAVGMADE